MRQSLTMMIQLGEISVLFSFVTPSIVALPLLNKMVGFNLKAVKGKMNSKLGPLAHLTINCIFFYKNSTGNMMMIPVFMRVI
jgi:hypothetical protein